MTIIRPLSRAHGLPSLKVLIRVTVPGMNSFLGETASHPTGEQLVAPTTFMLTFASVGTSWVLLSILKSQILSLYEFARICMHLDAKTLLSHENTSPGLCLAFHLFKTVSC